MTTTVQRTCPLCEATCGLTLTIENGAVTHIVGDDQDVLSRGFICPKGASLADVDDDPDRLRAPLVRRAGELVEATWDEAFEAVAAGLRPILEGDRNALAVYVGNPNVHTLAGQIHLKPMLKAAGTQNVFSASTVDQMPKHVSAGLMFGDPTAIPVPDIDRSEMIVIMGGDPMSSNGSLWTVPDFPNRLRELQRRGGRLVVIDPRRSRTARKADEHHAIRPGTDGLFAAALANVLLADGAQPGHHLDGHVAGLEQLAAALKSFTPEAVATSCGIAADDIRRLARELAERTGALYGRMGTTTTRFGTLTSWLVDVVNVLAGNLDVEGGAMFPASAALGEDRRTRRPFRTGRWTSRVEQLPEVLGELPVATMATEMLTEGPGQVRALITCAGNPVLSTPDGRRLDDALASLDFMVSVDPYLNETTRHADVILPPPRILQRAHLDLAFAGFSVRNVLNWSPPVFDLESDQLDEWEILVTLAAILLGQQPPVDVDAADDFVAYAVAERSTQLVPDDITAAEILEIVGGSGPERLVDITIRAGAHGDWFGTRDGITLATLKESPHGVDFGSLRPRIPFTLATASGRIELSPQPLLDDLPRLAAELERNGNGNGLTLVGRRHLRTNNSWMHNIPALARGAELCTLHVHPDDATRLGLSDGGHAKVSTDVGTIEALVEVTDDIRPGVVSLPHGFGHDRGGTRQRVAKQRPGVSLNDLTDGRLIDPLSGNAVLNAFPVEVVSA